ncbi:UDP-glucose 6-dehydrogenase, partial [Prochlorococcus sp. HOT_208_60]
LENPDRVLIGGENKLAIDSLTRIYLNWVPRNKILHTNIWSSELAKLTANAFLAQRISSINSIAALCEATGADVREVSRAIGSDNRIGSKFLNSGPGFGGSCFKKDILNLVYLSKYFGLEEVADFWGSVVNLNNWHQHRISKLIVKKLFGTVTGKKMFILGFSFKANTNDTRESSAINICKDLLDEGATLYIHDPKVSPNQIAKDLSIPKATDLNLNEGEWCFIDNLDEGFKNADAVIILTEWSEYKSLNWTEIAKEMRDHGWVFDTRSLISERTIAGSKLNLWRIGDGSKV